MDTLPRRPGGEGCVRPAIFGDHRVAIGVGGQQQQETDDDDEQDAERDPHPLAPEQGTPPRRRLVEIHIVSNHHAPPSRREATLAHGGAGSIYAGGWSDRRKVSGRNNSPITRDRKSTRLNSSH